MKKYLFISMAIIAFLFTSCEKEEEEENDNEIGTTYLKMQIDNETETTYEAKVTVSDGQINIVGIKEANSVQIQFSQDSSTGDIDAYTILYFENDLPVFNSANSLDSSLNLSKNDTSAKHIAGNFDVKYTDNSQNIHKAVGSFNLTY